MNARVVAAGIAVALISGQVLAVDLDDIFRHQYELQQSMKDMHEDIVARVSYKGDIDRAKADLNDLRCETSIYPQKDFGTKLSAHPSEKDQMLMQHWYQCVELQAIFKLMSFEERVPYFGGFPGKVAGYGASPYWDLWIEIKKNSALLGLLRSRAIRAGEGSTYIEDIDAKLKKLNSLP